MKKRFCLSAGIPEKQGKRNQQTANIVGTSSSKNLISIVYGFSFELEWIVSSMSWTALKNAQQIVNPRLKHVFSQVKLIIN
jgi:hypothetical protein